MEIASSAGPLHITLYYSAGKKGRSIATLRTGRIVENCVRVGVAKIVPVEVMMSMVVVGEIVSLSVTVEILLYVGYNVKGPSINVVGTVSVPSTLRNWKNVPCPETVWVCVNGE